MVLPGWRYKKNCRVEEVFLTNSRLGDGIEAVKNWAAEKLPVGPPLYPKSLVTEHPERFFVAEIVREKIFIQYSQEIPYSVQVLNPYLRTCLFIILHTCLFVTGFCGVCSLLC